MGTQGVFSGGTADALFARTCSSSVCESQSAAASEVPRNRWKCQVVVNRDSRPLDRKLAGSSARGQDPRQRSRYRLQL